MRIAALIALAPLSISAADIALVWDSNPTSDGVTNYRLHVLRPDGTRYSVDAGTNLTATVSVTPGRWRFAASAQSATGASELCQWLEHDVHAGPGRVRTGIRLKL
jgi:hypothetical protein